MSGIKRHVVRLTGTVSVLSAGLTALSGALSTPFRRSFAIRFAEQRARIERTGLAGMI